MAQDKFHKDLLLAGEIQYLHGLSIQLLDKTDQCLQKMDQSLAGREMMEGDNLYPACSHCLSILKELYQISKLYDGAEEKLWGCFDAAKKCAVSADSSICEENR